MNLKYYRIKSFLLNSRPTNEVPHYYILSALHLIPYLMSSCSLFIIMSPKIIILSVVSCYDVFAADPFKYEVRRPLLVV
jgi:hypothetical protein